MISQLAVAVADEDGGDVIVDDDTSGLMVRRVTCSSLVVGHARKVASPSSVVLTETVLPSHRQLVYSFWPTPPPLMGLSEEAVSFVFVCGIGKFTFRGERLTR